MARSLPRPRVALRTLTVGVALVAAGGTAIVTRPAVAPPPFLALEAARAETPASSTTTVALTTSTTVEPVTTTSPTLPPTTPARPPPARPSRPAPG